MFSIHNDIGRGRGRGHTLWRIKLIGEQLVKEYKLSGGNALIVN